MAAKRTDPEYRKGSGKPRGGRGYVERAPQESAEAEIRRLTKPYRQLIEAWPEIDECLLLAAQTLNHIGDELGEGSGPGRGFRKLAQRCASIRIRAGGSV